MASELRVTDFNDHFDVPERWHRNAVMQRYDEYARAFGLVQRTNIEPEEHVEGNRKWVYPIMDRVIQGIRQGDPACIELGLEFIEDNARFPFGRKQKSDTARALRQTTLSEQQKERVRRRVVAMLLAGWVPHEFAEYVRLLRKVSVGNWWPVIEEKVDRNNLFVMRHYEYLKKYAHE